MTAATITFTPVQASHRAPVITMLAEPNVRTWWGEPSREWDLIMEGEISGESQGFVVHLSNVVAGYIQCWIPGWDEAYYDSEPWQRDIPKKQSWC